MVVMVTKMMMISNHIYILHRWELSEEEESGGSDVETLVNQQQPAVSLVGYLLGKLYNEIFLDSALPKCSVVVGSIAGVVGSKHQVPLPARGLLVKSSVE